MKEQKEKRKRKKKETAQKENGSEPVHSRASISDDGSFFLHTPYLAFHDPPRVLYAGGTKHAIPVVLIHNSALWRTWKLQLGPSITKPGVLDPRGVVCWRHNGGDDKALAADAHLLKGYKVRTWRLWGETGKSYVHRVKANRDAGIGPDPDVIGDADPTKDGRSEKESAVSVADQQEVPARAEEVVYLKWTSPLSHNTRRYHFRFEGIDFYWKGTGTVKETRTCGFFCHFNHLKLVARLPSLAETQEGASAVQSEVCLGKYTSSIATKKSGKLDIFDGAVWRLISEHMPTSLDEASSVRSPFDARTEAAREVAKVYGVKRTLLYQVIVATAMCMIIGEKQKRDTIKEILETAAGEAGGASGT